MKLQTEIVKLDEITKEDCATCLSGKVNNRISELTENKVVIHDIQFINTSTAAIIYYA